MPPAVQALLAALLMWLLARRLPLPGPSWETPAALALASAALGAAVALAGVAAFRRARTTVDPRLPQRASALVSGGIYRYTRNPMYLGILLLLGGWALYLASPWSLLPLPLFVIAMNRLQIAAEERHLRDRFGDAYRDYCRRVRRWI